MKKSIFILTITLLISQSSFAQVTLPIIKANSEMIDIREGANFEKSAWKISPHLKPDRYITNSINSRVTFYTDIDSISFLVKPNEKYQFIVLLNGKDSALTEILYLPTYIEIIKKASKFDSNDKREIPKFYYQNAKDSNLVRLRKTFNLDSIAGSGNEISQILNLMHWIHDLIPHDGQNGNPNKLNAESMINLCKSENRGLNCRGLAIALNECYLSMGFKSRYVTCLPKDSLGIDSDCHVINTVYSKMLNKWIWIDPTNDAYVMNELGELLGIEEVRERIINEKPLILNPDANWNRKESTTKDHYLYNYMTKNLYILECPVLNEFDNETAFLGKTIQFVRLLPLDYFKQKPDKIVENYESFSIVRFNTNNPDLFWERK